VRQASRRISQLPASPTLAISAKAKSLAAAGRDVLNLSAGEPDFNTPEFIRRAACEALERGETRYTPADGTAELKQAVIDKFKRENGLDYEANQVIATTGAKQALFNAALAALDPGDEVIIPAPYWVSYPDMVLVADGKPVVIETGKDSAFKISPAQLDRAITSRTRLLVLNSPSNPSGKAYSRAELEALGEVLAKHPQILVATDDIYEHILWTGEPFQDIVTACPELVDRGIVLNGVSKAYAMTGWRIGYAAGPANLIAAMKKVQSQSTSNPASISQAAAEAALRGDQGCVAEMVKAFRERHDYVHEALNALPDVDCLPSDGTFYAFPDFSRVIARLDGVQDDVQLGEYFLNECGVALVPGSAFGVPGHMRLSFATSMENLRDALGRIDKLLQR